MINSALELVGKTPVVKLHKVNQSDCTILAKFEALNPSGSIKDVMALYMIDLAEKRGDLKPGGRIIEATSGNTGIAFAMLSHLKGYHFMAVMPEYMSQERIDMMRMFGAELVLTPTAEGFPGTVRRFEELTCQYPDAWFPRQFDNPDNTVAHREITGKNLLLEVGEKIDAFVAGVGTGGTLMGVSQALKKVYPDVKIIAVEPAEAAVMTGGEFNYHTIQGIGPGFVPDIVDMNMIDEVICISSDDAMNMAKKIIREEGLMVGISSGANVLACLQIALKLGKNKTIATILPDRMERYMSMGIM